MRNQSPRRSSGGQYNRGGNMESWLREHRDEDLALFQDMRSRERKNFLHPSNDDIEASLSTKFGGLTGYRLPSVTPPRKANNDLLATDSEKNDYDWLLTPPGTPLFPSLDQDTPLTHDSKRIDLAGMGVREGHSNISRGSPSPRRPSTALSASSANSSVRGRASSPSRTSSSPTHRPSTPSQSLIRTSTSLHRPSARSSTPTGRKVSTSPIVRASSTERIRSLSGQNRETSLKMQAWQTSVLGFPMETPPNLRTSIPDRPPSTSRIASSGSRHCDTRHSYSEPVDITRSRWRNASSFGSRSSSSSISQDRYSSKSSVVSSSDDGIEITQPTTSDNKAASPNGTVGDDKMFARSEDQARSRNNSSRKRQIRPTSTTVETSVFSNASVRKSLEPSMRQVDHRRVPQTMFRPLLSCAPASSFYNGGHSIVQYRPGSPIVESSITASSNASSEQGVRIVPGGESSDEEDKVNEIEWDNKNLSDVAASKTVVDEDDITNSEYMDVILGRYARHDYKEHFRQGSDDISSSIDANDFNRDDRFKMNKAGVDNSSDWTGQGALSERTWNGSEAGDHLMDNLTIATQFRPDEYDYASVDDDSACLDSQRDAIISPCGDDTADQLFVDIQEDLSVRSCSINLEDCLHSDLQGESFLCDEKPESETFHISQTFKLPCKSDKEATHTAEYESVIWSTQGQIGLPWPKESTNGSDSNQALSTDVDNGHLAVYDRDKIPKICTGSVLPGSCKDEYCTFLHSDSTIDSQGLVKSSAITGAAALSDTRNQVEIDRGSSPVNNIISVSNLHAENVDGSVLVAIPAQRKCTAPESLDSSQHYGKPNETHSLGCSEAAAGHPVDRSCRVESLQSTYSKDEWDEDMCNCSELPLGKDHGDVTPRYCKEDSGCDMAPMESCEYCTEISETVEAFKPSGTTGLNRSPRKFLLIDLGNALSPDDVIPMGQANLIEQGELEHLDIVASVSTLEATVAKDEEGSNHASISSDSEALPLDSGCMKKDVAVVLPSMICKASMNEAHGISMINVAERATPEVLGPGLKAQNLSIDKPLEMKAAFEGAPQLPSFSPGQSLPSSEDSQQCDISESSQFCAQSLQAISMPGNSADQLCNLQEDTTYESQGDTTAQTGTDILHEGIEEQFGFKDSSHRTRENMERKTVTRNFDLEEATNTILFCSSIVHDIVYKAASTAAEKDDSVRREHPYPVGIVVKHEFSMADYSNDHRGKALKSGNWKGRPREAILAVRRSLTNNYIKEEEVDEIPTITVHPAPIDGMRSDGMDEEKTSADASRIKEEKSPAKFTVNTNCQCTVM